MRELAPGVWQLGGFPRNAINCYLVGDVLVDAGTRHDYRWILPQLKTCEISAHALTHAHGDHQGSSHTVCTRLGVPFWVGAGDAAAAEAGGHAVYADMPQPLALMPRIYRQIMPGPGHPVDRVLREGDALAGFTVLETPGHSAGAVSLWRESDRTLIAGDAFTTMDVITLRRGLHEPKGYFTPDPARNRASLRRLAALEPALACVGHGPPLRDPAALSAFAAALPDG